MSAELIKTPTGDYEKIAAEDLQKMEEFINSTESHVIIPPCEVDFRDVVLHLISEIKDVRNRNCGNCKYKQVFESNTWDPVVDDMIDSVIGFECSKIIRMSEPNDSHHLNSAHENYLNGESAMVVDGEDYEARLIVKETFCCCLHEYKTEEVG